MNAVTDLDLNQTLVDRLRTRDQDALEELLAIYGREVTAVAYTICRNEADAEEVAADVFVTAWIKISALRDPRSLRAWLLRVTTRLAIKKQSRHPIPADAQQAPRNEPDPAVAVVDRDVLNSALDALPIRMRAVVALRYVADLTVPEVSAVLDRSPNTIKSELQRAMPRLRMALGGNAEYRRRTDE